MRIRRSALIATAGAVLFGSLPAVGAADEHDDLTDGPVVTRQVVTSFDGTELVTNLFLPPQAVAGEPVPLVLETHGWAGSGRTSPGGLSGQLVDAGYAVLTSDARGFGCSAGEVRIDDPQVEGRDMSALIDWAVDNAPVLHRDGDPVVGMIGGSYAGGIQTATASIDPRIDAIAPQMSWSDLNYSLFPGEVVKQGWITLLYAAGVVAAEGDGLDRDCDAGVQTGGLDPAIHAGVTEFLTTGTVGQATQDFFAASSLAGYGDQDPVAIPTLVMNSSVDTLFNVTDGLAIHEHVRAQGAPSRMMVYCGGHVSCPTTYRPADDTAFMRDAVVEWFAEHLLEQEVPQRPLFEYRTNEGIWRSSDTVPSVDDDAVSLTTGSASLVVAPVLDVPDVTTLAREFEASGGTLPATPLTAAAVSRDGDPRAVTHEVVRATDGPLDLVGVPEVELTVDGIVLETLDALPVDTLDRLTDALALDGLELVADGVGATIGRIPVLGGLVTGLVGGLLQTSLGDAVPTDVHVFVKLVHRESGDVIDVQEGAVNVSLADGPATVPVRMPGVAYTLPEGDHLDLQISTASLMHATGRVPALVDVAVDVRVPTLEVDRSQDPDPGDGGPGDGGPGDGGPGDGGPGDGGPGDGGPGDGGPGDDGPAEPTRTPEPGTTVRGIDLACARTPSTTFDDVTDPTTARAAGCLADRDVTQGVSDGRRFDPSGTVTRGQMASFVVRSLRAAGVELPEGPSDRFDDVDPGDVHARNINALAASGIVRGRTATTYEPGGHVTRDQMAAFLDAAWDRVHPVAFPEPDRPPFRDLRGGPHDASIERIAVVGITTGINDRGDYAPRRAVTRRQMASFLTRWLDHAVEQGHAPPA